MQPPLQEPSGLLDYLRLAADHIPVLISYVDREGRFRYANRAYESWFGISAESIIGRPVHEVLGPAAFERTNPYRERAIRGERVEYEDEVPYQGAGTRIIHATYVPDGSPPGVKGYAAVVTDVTARKAAERLLADELRAVRRLNAVGEFCARPGIALQEGLDEIMAASLELTGAPKGNVQVLDAVSGALRIAVHAGLGEEFLRFFARVGVEDRAACGRTLSSGIRTLVEDVQGSPVFAGSEALGVLLRAGVRAVQSTSLVSSAGQVIGMISTHYDRPHRFDDRTLGWLDLLARQAADFIERKRAEREIRALNASLEERVNARTADLSQALHELETFSYTIAHDLRAPLRTMRGFSELLLEDVGRSLGAEAQDAARRIVEGADRMDVLTRDLLEYARVSQVKVAPEEVDLDRVVSDVLLTLEREIRSTSASVRVASPLGATVASRTLISQALSNLVSNACKFVGPGQKPDVEIGAERTDGRLKLWVRDSGIGIETRHQSKLFGMFERLDPSIYPGTGIGLAIVKKAAERMSGRAGMESERGKGSRFWIEIPARPQRP